MTPMETLRKPQQTALNSSSPASAPTTPSPALATTSFSLSATSVSPVASDDLRPGSRSRSGSISSTATTALPPSVAFAIDCINQQFLGYSRPQPRQRRFLPLPDKQPAAQPNERGSGGQVEKNAIQAGIRKSESEETNEWLEIRLTNSEWLVLQDHIDSLYQSDLGDYIQDKQRYDYFPRHDLLVLRFRRTCMPSRIHESFITKINSHILKQLEQLGTRWRERDPGIAQLTDEIESWGHLRMRFAPVLSRSPSSGPEVDAQANSEAQRRKGQHEPDCSYSVTRPEDPDCPNEYPGVIIEIATSQKRPRLRQLAEEYLLGTDDGPAVQAVLAVDIDLEYVGSGAPLPTAAKIIEFRRHFERVEGEEGEVCVVHEKEHFFRQPDGERVVGEVRLNLSDFAPYGVDPRLPEPDAQAEAGDLSISLDFNWLNDILHRAEVAAQRASTAGTKRKASVQDGPEEQAQPEQARKRPWPPGLKRRGSRSVPIERLTDTDETRMQREEEQADRRAEDDEEDYEPSPRDRDRADANERREPRRSSRRVNVGRPSTL